MKQLVKRDKGSRLKKKGEKGWKKNKSNNIL